MCGNCRAARAQGPQAAQAHTLYTVLCTQLCMHIDYTLYRLHSLNTKINPKLYCNTANNLEF